MLLSHQTAGAATRAIAALKAALDIQAGTSNLPTRDVAAMLALDWWMSGVATDPANPGLHGNVATVRHGLDAMQFVRLADGSFLPPPGRGGMKFQQTGLRSKQRYICTTSGTNPVSNPEAISRGWVGPNVTFKLTHPGGDEMSFGWYEMAYGPAAIWGRRCRYRPANAISAIASPAGAFPLVRP